MPPKMRGAVQRRNAKDLMWGEMTAREQAAIRCLGWATQDSWDEPVDGAPSAYNKRWDQLSSAQQDAALLLGMSVATGEFLEPAEPHARATTPPKKEKVPRACADAAAVPEHAEFRGQDAAAAASIQAVWRGHLGRRNLLGQLEEERQELQLTLGVPVNERLPRPLP
jgi:hypothetical protein